MQLSKEPLGSELKGNAGFTLIELAIVLVVIGLIIAAVLKGEDLINNGKMLNFVSNPVQKAQTAAMAYYDRTGQFPSVSTTGGTTKGPLYQMYQAGINDVLGIANPFTKGSNNFIVALGILSNNGINYPVIVIKPVNLDATTGAPTGGRAWQQSDIGYANYLKSRIDGSTSNWQTGSVRMLQVDVPLVWNTALATEINSAATGKPPYDLRITGTGVYTNNTNPFSSLCATDPSAAVGAATDTLVYFYDQQPY
jgi:prepilin-type N-terminal cleavage/methylation domain-containing protein